MVVKADNIQVGEKFGSFSNFLLISAAFAATSGQAKEVPSTMQY